MGRGLRRIASGAGPEEDHWGRGLRRTASGAGPSSADLHTGGPAGLGLRLGRQEERSSSFDFPPFFGLSEWKILTLSFQKKFKALNPSWIYCLRPVLADAPFASPSPPASTGGQPCAPST